MTKQELIAQIRAFPKQCGHDDDDPLVNEVTEASLALVEADDGIRALGLSEDALAAISVYAAAMERVVKATAAVVQHEKAFQDWLLGWLKETKPGAIH